MTRILEFPVYPESLVACWVSLDFRVFSALRNANFPVPLVLFFHIPLNPTYEETNIVYRFGHWRMKAMLSSDYVWRMASMGVSFAAWLAG